MPQRVLLARTEDVAVALLDVVAFSTGLEFAVEVRLRELDELSDPFGFHLRHTVREGGAIPDEVLRFGFELADGGKATNLGGFPGPDAPSGPVLMQRGGGGGGRSWSLRHWLWPLPPEGPLTVVVEWPRHGIQLTRIEVDGEPLRQAAAMSEALWPGASPSSGGASFTSSRS